MKTRIIWTLWRGLKKNYEKLFFRKKSKFDFFKKYWKNNKSEKVSSLLEPSCQKTCFVQKFWGLESLIKLMYFLWDKFILINPLGLRYFFVSKVLEKNPYLYFLPVRLYFIWAETKRASKRYEYLSLKKCMKIYLTKWS